MAVVQFVKSSNLSVLLNNVASTGYVSEYAASRHAEYALEHVHTHIPTHTH